MIRHAFEIPGTPIGKARPRMGKRGVYTPSKTVAAEKAIALIAQAAGVRPIAGPVRMEITAVFAVAPSWSNARKAAALAGVWHTSKPDRDNIEKLVCDALNGIAYADDSQVCDGPVRKIYGDRARTIVVIESADQAVEWAAGL